MTGEFKRGLILGLSMQPLYVATSDSSDAMVTTDMLSVLDTGIISDDTFIGDGKITVRTAFLSDDSQIGIVKEA